MGKSPMTCFMIRKKKRCEMSLLRVYDIVYDNIVIVILTMCNLTLIEYVSHFAKNKQTKLFS